MPCDEMTEKIRLYTLCLQLFHLDEHMDIVCLLIPVRVFCRDYIVQQSDELSCFFAVTALFSHAL